MNKLFIAAREVCDFIISQKWQYCVIGGLAVIRWGEVRFTQDADISVLAEFGGEREFAESLLQKFPGRISDALAFALNNRVLLIRSSNGVSIDITFAALPFEQQMMACSSPFDYGDGCLLRTCSADDLFVMKAFAARPKDWIDAESIAIRQKGKLDKDKIVRCLSELSELKGEPEILNRACKILEIS